MFFVWRWSGFGVARGGVFVGTQDCEIGRGSSQKGLLMQDGRLVRVGVGMFLLWDGRVLLGGCGRVGMLNGISLEFGVNGLFVRLSFDWLGFSRLCCDRRFLCWLRHNRTRREHPRQVRA